MGHYRKMSLEELREEVAMLKKAMRDPDYHPEDRNSFAHEYHIALRELKAKEAAPVTNRQRVAKWFHIKGLCAHDIFEDIAPGSVTVQDLSDSQIEVCMEGLLEDYDRDRSKGYDPEY